MYELCECKHFGGMSPNSSHVDKIQAGHGACSECDCRQFTWVKFCNADGEDYSDKEWPGIDFSMDIDDTHQFSIFYGSQRGGLICANGVCAYQPAFEDGFKISFKSLF